MTLSVLLINFNLLLSILFCIFKLPKKVVEVSLVSCIIISFYYKLFTIVGLLFLLIIYIIAKYDIFTKTSEENKDIPLLDKLDSILYNFLIFATLVIAGSLFYSYGVRNLTSFYDVKIGKNEIDITLPVGGILASIIIYYYSSLYHLDKRFNIKNTSFTLISTIVTILILIPLGYILKLINYEFKISEYIFIWALINFLTCFSEEIIFRGVIQKKLLELFGIKRLPLIITFISIVFTLFHDASVSYSAMIIVASVCYGYIYYKTNSISSVTVAHFLVNLCHFIFFSYPYIQN